MTACANCGHNPDDDAMPYDPALDPWAWSRVGELNVHEHRMTFHNGSVVVTPCIVDHNAQGDT